MPEQTTTILYFCSTRYPLMPYEETLARWNTMMLLHRTSGGNRPLHEPDAGLILSPFALSAQTQDPKMFGNFMLVIV